MMARVETGRTGRSWARAMAYAQAGEGAGTATEGDGVQVGGGEAGAVQQPLAVGEEEVAVATGGDVFA